MPVLEARSPDSIGFQTHLNHLVHGRLCELGPIEKTDQTQHLTREEESFTNSHDSIFELI